MVQYYYILRSVLRANPHLRKCMCRCRHCGIFFLTHPRNAGRRDLGCPFGCGQAHRKENSKRRSAEYYRSEEGKKKKRAHNRRRSLQLNHDDNSKDLTNEGSVAQQVEVIRDRLGFARDNLYYIQMVISLIEGRYVSLDEILRMLQKIMRQHSMCKQGRFEYAVIYNKRKTATSIGKGTSKLKMKGDK